MALGLAAFLAVTYGVRYIYVAATTTTVTDLFVRDSERVCDKTGKDCKYLAFGQNETYENVDEWVFAKYNSSDVNKVLVKGNSCRLKVHGFRFGYMSWYRNIITADCVPNTK
jgi:hypothetical protein